MNDFVFISYSREDSEFTSKLIAMLNTTGYDVWIDNSSISGGQLWREKIVDAISTCQLFLIVLSPHSVKSNNVRKELDLADKKNKPIIPIVIGATEIPPSMEYQLAGIQWIDFHVNFTVGFESLGKLLTSHQQGTLQKEFANHLSNVLLSEKALPESVKNERANIYTKFTKHLWNSPPELRFEHQKMFTLAHLKKIGLTISQLKVALKKLELYEGKMDNSFDPKLATAIVQFQLNNGLEPDGICGSMTYMKIAAQLQIKY
jgi:hypothetical protein